MSIVTSELIEAARDIADIPDNPHVEDPTLLRWANRGIERAYKIALAHAPSIFQTSSMFTLVGGLNQNTTSVPATLRRLVHVAKDPTNPSLRRTLRQYNADEKEGVVTLSYRREGSLVVIEPYVAAAGSYALYFIAGPTKLVNLSDPMDAILEPCAEYVETYMAIKAIQKEEGDARELREELAELKSDLEIDFTQLESGTAETIVDVDNTGDRWPWDCIP